jgi:flagellar basal-body rod modification protein FlgD
MSAGAISGAATLPTSQAGAFGDLSSEDFVKVMISELTNQDPLDPQDSGALLEQLSSLRNIESQLALQEQLGNLVLQNQIASAGSLIGKLITGQDANFDQIEGLVTSVRVEDGTVFLELDSGRTLSMDRVTEIANPSPSA